MVRVIQGISTTTGLRHIAEINVISADRCICVSSFVRAWSSVAWCRPATRERCWRSGARRGTSTDRTSRRLPCRTAGPALSSAGGPMSGSRREPTPGTVPTACRTTQLRHTQAAFTPCGDAWRRVLFAAICRNTPHHRRASVTSPLCTWSNLHMA